MSDGVVKEIFIRKLFKPTLFPLKWIIGLENKEALQ
jgi:hypothetical protein